MPCASSSDSVRSPSRQPLAGSDDRLVLWEPLETRVLLSASLAGFTQSAYGSHVNSPTAMAFAPDGRLFVSQQAGQLRIIKNGQLLPTPFATLSVDDNTEGGLLGIAFDPHFSTNHFLYVDRTVASTAAHASPHNVITRLTANGDSMVPGSAVNIFELSNLNGFSHLGGAIHFGADGKLYIVSGDNHHAPNAQTLANTSGKILRINADGSIPSDDPFFNATTGSARAIWALGLRNPFTFAVQPGTGQIFINDVGENTWEEVDRGVSGANYGWPGIEGPRNGQPLPTIGAYHDPIYAYTHGPNEVNGSAITGGDFYNPPTVAYPSSFVGKYFYTDLGGGYIKTVDTAHGNAVSTFATGLSNPDDLHVGPDGNVYVLTRGAASDGSQGQVFRFTTTPTPTPTPTPTTGAKVLSATADAYVRDGSSAGQNFGADAVLQAKQVNAAGFSRVSYIKFDLSSVSTISSAKLTLSGEIFAGPEHSVSVGVDAVSNTAWSEKGLTFNNRPALGASLGKITLTSTSFKTYTLDLTSYLKQQKAAGHNIVSIGLVGLAPVQAVGQFQSRESGHGATLSIVA